MNEVEVTRVMKELVKLLHNMFESEEDEVEIEEKLEEIKSELGSWFIDGYQLYHAS